MAIASGIMAALAANKLATGIGIGVPALFAAKDVFGQVLQHGLAKKQLSTQEKLMAGQLESTQTATEANRAAAAEYLDLIRTSKAEDREDKAADRRMQLIMMMMQGISQVGQTASQNQFQADLPAPPTSIIGLMRGGR